MITIQITSANNNGLLPKLSSLLLDSSLPLSLSLSLVSLLILDAKLKSDGMVDGTYAYALEGVFEFQFGGSTSTSLDAMAMWCQLQNSKWNTNKIKQQIE